MLFRKAAPGFFNFARIEPDILTIVSIGGSTKALKIRGTDRFAIGLMPLRVTESYLYQGVSMGPGNVHRLTGLPSCQEYRRDVSMWGTKLEFPEEGLTGSVGAMGVSFNTRWEKASFQGLSRYLLISYAFVY